MYRDNNYYRRDRDASITGTVVGRILILAILYLSFKLLRRKKKLVLQKKDAIFISGCDSGIGYSLAHYCHKLGMTVVAGCYRLGEGACELEELENVHVIPLDVTNVMSVRTAASKIRIIMEENPGTVLRTIVNNAGVMIFGEFAWQTATHAEQQVHVNLLGAMNLTHALLPLIIESQGRIINICSHCSLESLPGLSIYAASKAGLLAWSDALRIELKKFKVAVVSFIPGSFPFETNILSSQTQYASEMQENMSECDWELYESYFVEYNSYLSGINQEKKLKKIEDKYFYRIFDDALRQLKPRNRYCYSNWRYWFYHSLFKITPTFIHDYLVLCFMNMPKWKRRTSSG